MDRSHIALAAPGRGEPPQAAHRQYLHGESLAREGTRDAIETDAVASDHHEVGDGKLPPHEGHLHGGVGVQDLDAAGNAHESVGTAEGSDAPASLSHGIRGEAAAAALDQPHEQVLEATSLRVRFLGEARRDGLTAMRWKP
jgi:hypothetical protein